MDDKIYKSVLLEFRPRIQSVNGFVELIPYPQFVDICLENDAVVLNVNQVIKRVYCTSVQIMVDSLSSIKITNKFISFRFLTNNTNDNAGTFKTEFLQNTVASIESLSSKPLLSKGTQYRINCWNCKHSLSDVITFDRILPLPSECSDSSDWFCHNHGNNVDFSLDPKESDAFYSHCFVHLNKNNIKNWKESNKILVCKFCLQWLGTQQNVNTLKLWFNTVSFSNDSNQIHTSSLADVHYAVKNSFRHSFHNSSKLIVSCQTSPCKTDTLLLWILDKKLQILYGETDVATHNVAKVLFKFVGKDDALLHSWQNDSLVSNLDVSKPMMVDLLNKLHSWNKLFPPEYAKSNDFKVSYLFLYDGF